MNLDERAQDLYRLKYEKPDNNVSIRCIVFKAMEKLAKE